MTAVEVDDKIPAADRADYIFAIISNKCKKLISLKLTIRATFIALKLQISLALRKDGLGRTSDRFPGCRDGTRLAGQIGATYVTIGF